MIKVSRMLKENGAKISRAAQEWRAHRGCEPTIQELSSQTGLDYGDIVMAISASAEVDSIYRPVPGAEGKEMVLQDQIPDERDEMDRELNRVFLEQLLRKLDGEERKLIWLRYFQGKTQTEVAGILNITQVQVSRKEKNLLEKMRKSAG